ncbi:VLRF1 family aeRF1-type release factor [Bacillus sp. 37MA]|uniref:VLRF1 family aeRF1-type release factor n=1 Tax=Bacillus sp. 37MA TaxID=1132442 RepID=UPI00037CAA25|nr:VLRF1 family aeRF1-type release factor [Bacillus sp. 37MA]
MTLNKELQILKKYHSGERGVLSVYLNTNPGDPDQLNGAWQIHLKNGLKDLDKYLTDSKNETELKLFKEAKKKVLKEIDDNKDDLHKGVVIFASKNPKLWSVHYVQVPVKSSFHWEDHPVLEELEYMHKAYPEAGIILPSFGEVRILDTAMGMVKEDFSYSFNPNLEEWGEMKNMDPDGKHVIGSSKVDFLESRLKENLKRFFKGMGTNVERLKKERGWIEIHVAGETELAIAFAETLREKPASCIYKNLNNSKPGEVINQVLENLQKVK